MSTQGDSGGPLMVLVRNSKNEHPRATLIGTLVAGPVVLGQTFYKAVNYDQLLASPASYTRVDKRFDWIKATVNGK